MSNQIIYSLVVRKKNTILCEYSEHSGNFQQIALKIIRKALSVQLNIFRSVVKYDDYIFDGSKESVRKQTGMAVPCKGAKIIFEAILKTFAGIEYESMEASLRDEGEI